MSRRRKLIAFDMDTKALKTYYPSSSWRTSYKDIKTYMAENGFIWQEGSTYISEGYMSWANATVILEGMRNELPWTENCMRDCVMANIDSVYNQNYIFKERADSEITKETISKQKEDITEEEI